SEVQVAAASAWEWLRRRGEGGFACDVGLFDECDDAFPGLDVGVVERRNIAARAVWPAGAAGRHRAKRGDGLRVALGFGGDQRVPPRGERMRRRTRWIALERVGGLLEQRHARRAGAIGSARA